MKQFTLISILFMLSLSVSFSQERTLNCQDRSAVNVKARDIKNDVIRNSGFVKKAEIAQLNNEKKNNYQKQYELLRSDFNALYDKMKDDAQNRLASKKKICRRYGAKLEELVNKAQEYNKNINSDLNLQAFGVGIDDLLALIQLILENRKENLDEAYEKLKWPDWKDIPERSFS